MRVTPETMLYETSEQPLILSGYKFLLLTIKQITIVKSSMETPARVRSIILSMMYFWTTSSIFYYISVYSFIY